MYKIVFKNFLLPVLLLIVSILLSVAVGFIGLELPSVTLPAWLLVGVVLVVSVIATVAMYPRGEIKHYLALAGIIFGFYAVSMLVILGVAIGLSNETILILSAGDLKINVLSLILPILAAVIAAKLLIKVEFQKTVESKPEIKAEPVAQKEEKRVLEDKPVELKKEEPVVEQVIVEAQQSEVKEELSAPQEDVVEEPSEEVFFEDIVEEKPAQETGIEAIVEEEEPQEEIFFEDIMEEKPALEPVIEETPEESQEEIFFEDIMEEKPEEKVTPVVVEPDYSEPKVQEPELGDLGELPSLDADLDNLSEEEDAVEEKEEIVNIGSDVEEDDEVIVSEDEKVSDKLVMHKLADAPTSKEVETGGKISAIGKLLVDQRDIENIIETNALMQSVGADSTTTNIISVTEGMKVNESLDALKDVEGIKSCVIVNDAGFIQASSLDDLHKEQVIGAMASGVFGVVSNSLTKIGFSALKDIVFESETGNISLSRSKGNIFSIFTQPNASIYLMDEVNDFLVTAAEREPEDLMSSISSLNGVIGAVLSSGDGQLVASKLIDDSKNPNDIAEILPAFYSNLGVFIRNMDQGTLRKAVVATSSEILLLTSIGDNILMAYATINTSILPKDIKIQYETILNL